MIRVEVFQTKDGLWHLQSFCQATDQVYMLLTRSKLIEVINMASELQLRIDSKVPINQYYVSHDTIETFDYKAA